MAGRDLGGAYRWTARVVGLVLVVLVGGLVARGLGASPPVLATTAHASRAAHTSSAPLAPNGSFVTPTGAMATIKSLEGQPTMVWFVAGGCASCSVSIPAVAAHLGELRRDGVRVLTLGLYGSFPPGARGARKVVAFGRAVLGASPERPGWEWGMSSKALSLAYDPTGYPDSYTLVGVHGHVRYQNAVPVSTMAALLRAARALAKAR